MASAAVAVISSGVGSSTHQYHHHRVPVMYAINVNQTAASYNAAQHRAGGGGGGARRASAAAAASALQQKFTIRERVVAFFKGTQTKMTGDPLDYDISIPARYVPQPIDVLVARTKFTHDEVKRLYCGWKQNCPYGVVDKDQFIKCFSEIYPAGGDCKPYASRVFDAIMERSDKQQYDGIVQVVAHACDPEGIDFERFIMFLSQIMRGTDEQKLEWCFCLYDRDRRGFITQKNIVDFTFSIYELLDEEHVLPRLQYSSVYKQAISTYQKLDTAHRGTITKDEFIAACLQDNVIRQSLNVFDSMI